MTFDEKDVAERFERCMASPDPHVYGVLMAASLAALEARRLVGGNLPGLFAQDFVNVAETRRRVLKALAAREGGE